MLVKDQCGQCKTCIKIVDYIWDRDTGRYIDKIKQIGYLCVNKEFKKKYYRFPDNYIGERGCALYQLNTNQMQTVYNNQIINTKKG